jgi:hypothetical protein
MTARPKQNREKKLKHRRWIASLPCVITGAHDVQCAHISKGRHSMGMKACDSMCVPLSCSQHAKQHGMSEEKFWEPHGGIDRAKALANALYEVSGDNIEALRLIQKWRSQR